MARLDLRSQEMRARDLEYAQTHPRRVTYVLDAAPGESLLLKRSGPYGYFPLRYFATWQEWEAYKALNGHLWAAPDRLFEGPLPPGWAGSPAAGVVRVVREPTDG